MSDIPPGVRDLLDAHPWEDTVPRLVKYARAKMRELVWQGIFGGPAPGGQQAYDLVADAVGKLLDGRRAWDPEAQPDLFLHLRGIVDSDVGHLAVSLGNRLTLRAAGRRDDDEADDAPDPIESHASTTPDPEAKALLDEQARLSDEFLIELDLFLQDEPDLQTIVEAIVDDAEKPAEIAATLKIDVKSVYAARKRLQRRVEVFRAQRSATRKASQERPRT